MTTRDRRLYCPSALRLSPRSPVRAALLLLLISAPVGCSRISEPVEWSRRIYSESRFALGPVMVQIQVAASSEAEARRAIDRAFEAVDRVNRVLSFHRADSELARLNDSAGRECAVSDELGFVLRRALEFGELTGGAFDVTAGPLIRLWKKGIRDVEALREAMDELDAVCAPRDLTGRALIRVVCRAVEPALLPDPAALAAAGNAVGYKNVALGSRTATLKLPGMSVDLGGIAKGYAVDRAVAALKEAGITAALVDAGGDGYALGRKPDGKPWRIGVQNPRADEGERLDDVLILSDSAYATSGDYEQHVDVGGLRYAHIVDPRTGQPARRASSVTITATDCTTADALATGVSVLGADDGVRLVESLKGVECMVITADDGNLRIRTSRGFGKLTSREPHPRVR